MGSDETAAIAATSSELVDVVDLALAARRPDLERGMLVDVIREHNDDAAEETVNVTSVGCCETSSAAALNCAVMP